MCRHQPLRKIVKNFWFSMHLECQKHKELSYSDNKMETDQKAIRPPAIKRIVNWCCDYLDSRLYRLSQRWAWMFQASSLLCARYLPLALARLEHGANRFCCPSHRPSPSWCRQWLWPIRVVWARTGEAPSEYTPCSIHECRRHHQHPCSLHQKSGGYNNFY